MLKTRVQEHSYRGLNGNFPFRCKVHAAWKLRNDGSGNMEWYYGYISCWNIDGTYNIKFKDGDSRYNVPSTEIELKPEPSENGESEKDISF